MKRYVKRSDSNKVSETEDGRIKINYGPVTWTGFNKNDNGKIWVEKGNDCYYVVRQTDEFGQGHTCIFILTADSLESFFQHRYLSEYAVPLDIRRYVQNGGTAYWWHHWDDESFRYVDEFSKDLDKLIDTAIDYMKQPDREYVVDKTV